MTDLTVCGRCGVHYPTRTIHSCPIADTASAAIWQAVDRLTKPVKQRIPRELTVELAAAQEAAEHRARTLAALPEKERHPAEHYITRPVAGMTARTVETPSLWDQAVTALETGREQQTGGTRSPLATRSVIDADLLEIVHLIRDTVTDQLRKRRAHNPALTTTHAMRRLASEVIAQGNELDWWEYRFASWARLITTYLHAGEHHARPVRLRNSPCPLCRTQRVTIDTDAGPVVAGPLLAEFVDDRLRAIVCTACGGTWWRGEDLHTLAEQLTIPAAGGLTA